MLESISARGWGRASFVVACIAVVVIGYVYGSELRACGPNPSPFAQHRQCPSQQQAGCSLVALALFGSCIFHLLHYSSTAKFDAEFFTGKPTSRLYCGAILSTGSAWCCSTCLAPWSGCG